MTDTYKQFAIKTDNIAAFRDTVTNFTRNPELKAATTRSAANQKVFREYDLLRNLPEGTRNAEIKISSRKTLDAAREYAIRGKKVAVLNCASAVKPGGETENGNSSQEECLCRCTNLYPCLNTADAIRKFYTPHKTTGFNAPHTMSSCLTNDDCIYTPDVTVIKEDNYGYKMLREEDWFNVDVISCSAPEFITAFTSPFISAYGTGAQPDSTRIENVYRKRFERILNIARYNGVDVVILDFWGYKRSEENAAIVAEAAYKAAEGFTSCFDVIEAAVGYSFANENTYNIYAKAFDKDEQNPEASSSVM